MDFHSLSFMLLFQVFSMQVQDLIMHLMNQKGLLIQSRFLLQFFR